MTREEAIRILDPETRRETMKQIPVFERIAADQEACRLAVSAIRAQQEPNAPLTLDELREMDGEPVWLAVNTDRPQWAFVVGDHHEEFISFNCADGTEWEFDLFGDNDGVEWIAYRRKPEEGA